MKREKILYRNKLKIKNIKEERKRQKLNKEKSLILIKSIKLKT